MSTLTASIVLVALSALVYVVLILALARADKRAERRRSTDAPTPVTSESEHRSLWQRPSPHRFGGGPMYVEVGAWSGRTYPSGAVVVGYNGKAHSRVAVAWGAREAASLDRPLVVLYAANYSGMTGDPGPGLHHRDPGALEAADEVTARGVAEAVAAQPGLDVVGATEVTSPVRALTEASRDAALIVVGSRRHGRLARTLLGSVSSRVAARARSPVVIVIEDAADPSVGPEQPVIDGTERSAEVDVAVRLAPDIAAGVSSDLVDSQMAGRPRARTPDLVKSDA
jgi:nucleotide-binding universal stress UspA family protein